MAQIVSSGLMVLFVSLSCFFPQLGNAAAYYNTGMHWKGGVNPYWLGTVTSFQSFTQSGLPNPGSGYGVLGHPEGVAVDSSGNVYGADFNHSRIVKYDSSGAFVGWIGKIATSPTGGAAGCAGAAVGTFTPGWCQGGDAVDGTADGMMNGPNAVSVDSSGYLYVADSGNGRVSKYSSSGAFLGWIGAIGAQQPTGGASGCTDPANTYTSGWCTGGTSRPVPTGYGGFYFPSYLASDSLGNIYVSDPSNHRVVKFNSSGVFQGWIGAVGSTPNGGASGCSTAAAGTFTPGWCQGGAAQSGTGDGMFGTPAGIGFDSANNLYVVTDSRVSKYNPSTGAFLGWIGKIGTSPTGGAAGCSGATVGTFTPGWCTGGTTASSGTGDGMIWGPGGIAFDSSNNFYVSDYIDNRISKYNSSGAFQGWIGKIATSPTGGAAGCSGAGISTLTPGWCKGGTSTSGNGDGMMDTPFAVAIDASGSLYVADSNNDRINRYSSSGAFSGSIQVVTQFQSWHRSNASGSFTSGDGMFATPSALAFDSSGNMFVVNTNGLRVTKYNSSGAFQGWIGKIYASPTGGAAGCNGAAAGSFTPGWCTGGYSTFGNGNGMFYFPKGLALDSSGNIYVADSGNHRINKYNSSGAFQGWIGKIATSPTGGATGCSGASVGAFTPGWCTGGTPTSGSGDGMMNSPVGVALDSSGNIYVADSGNHRINKYNSSGAFQGWIGKIATSPTGGASGCSGASVGAFTPGWCTGGTSASGTGDGMLNGALGVAFDPAGNLYVGDTSNNRINKYNSLGAFQGWIGKIATSPTGGATGCNGAAVGSSTPGWCTGGTSASGTGNGMMNGPQGLVWDSSGNLYVADTQNHRINKFNSSGVFQGWYGKTATSPTGGATGCNGAAAGTLTPGWCTGGTSTSGSGDGMLNAPLNVALNSSGNLYIADSNNGRIIRFSIRGR